METDLNSLLQWKKKEAFSMYASAKGIKLGVDGKGFFVVKSLAGDTFRYANPHVAIKKFTDLIKQ